MEKAAELKRAEIKKEIPAETGTTLLQDNDKDLPDSAIDALSAVSPETACGTTASMGIVLKPKEFQKIMLIRAGKGEKAQDLEDKGLVFPKVDDVDEMEMPSSSFLPPSLASMLLPLMAGRSALGPYSSTRIVMIKGSPKKTESSHNDKDLRKISAAYNGYRQSLMDMVATAQDKLPLAAPADESVAKLASANPSEVFTPLTFSYLKEAHQPPSEELPKSASVRGFFPHKTREEGS